MNDKNIMLDKNGEQNEVILVSHRKVLVSLLAAVICLLLAALVWVCVMNTQDTDYIPIRVVVPAEYECVLSVDGVEVEGAVATLRTLKELKEQKYPGELYLYSQNCMRCQTASSTLKTCICQRLSIWFLQSEWLNIQCFHQLSSHLISL